MSNKGRAVMTALMLTMLIGQTVAIPLIIPLVAGGIAGGILGYIVGTNFIASDEVENLKQQYESALTSQKEINDANIQQLLLEVYARDSNIYGVTQDFGQYTKNYAWALAKYEAVKALKEGKTVAEAQAAARNAVINYYANVSKTVVNTHNATINLLLAIQSNYSATAGLSSFEFIDSQGSKYYYDTNSGTWKFYLAGNWYAPSFNTGTNTVTIAGKTYSYTKMYLRYDKTGSGTFYNYDVRTVKYAGAVVYDRTGFDNAVSAINSAYNEIINNVDAYVQNLANQVNLAQINLTDIIDPYQLASLMNSDYNATGYYGYAAAELALLGLNTAGINKTIVIEVNGTQYEGFLFTDWQGVLETNKTYTANASYKYFIAVDGGLYEIPAGENFTVLAIRDFNGNTLNNTTLKSYTSALQDVNQIYDELAALRQLWQEYIEMQAIMAGGGGSSGGFDFSAWWASLDQTAKLGVVVIGAVGLYAVLRRK
jgi:hypothetical protein